MKYATLLLASAFACSASLQAETPNIIFSDDFSDPSELETTEIGTILIPSEEIWGEESVVNQGSFDEQWIQVRDVNAEQLFGEAGNNYMEIWTSGFDPGSMWLVGQNRFSEASDVITISMEFNHPGSDDLGPSLRTGVNNVVFNSNRARQDARFENGNFAGGSNVYELNQPQRLELIYNNSPDTIAYLDGQVELISDAYDVWIDGELILRNHRYNSHDSDTTIGTGLESLAFVVFGNARNHLYVNEVIVYDDAFVMDPVSVPEPPDEEGLIFADDFSDPEPDGTPNIEIWGADAIDNRGNEANQWVRVTDENSEEYFGEAGNNYLEVFSDGADGSVWISAVNRFLVPSQVVTVNLDFYNSDSDDVGPTMRLGVNDPIQSNNNRAHYQFGFENDAVNAGEAVIENNRTQNLQLVYNNSESDVTYADGQATVASDSYDVWIDGVLVLSDVQYGFFDSANAPLGTPLSSWGLGIFGSGQNELRIDNLKIFQGARVTPAAAGMTFASWADAEGIPEGQRGVFDDPAGDGIPNGVKFALGLPAMTPAAGMLPSTERVAVNGDEFLALRFTRPTDRAGVQLKLEGSGDLLEWLDLEAELEVIEEVNGSQVVRLVDSEAIGGHERRFLRLSVELDD